MAKGTQDDLLDDVMLAYVEWREEIEGVNAAYRQWSIAPSTEAAGAFTAYVAALDREERASTVYEHAIRRIVVLRGPESELRDAA